MTTHTIISASPRMLENWRDALGAHDCALRADVDVETDSNTVIWLDWDSYGPEEGEQRLSAIALPAARLIVMSAHPNAGQAMAMFARGARGYCYRFAAASQMREIALVVEHGGLWLGDEAMQRFLNSTLNLVDRHPQLRTRDSLTDELTDKEWSVATEVARGKSNREIADALSISERTVKSHLTAVFDKLQVRDRVQLALLLNNIPAQ